jgi:hypothetical protein
MDILNSNSTSYSKSQRITALITLIVFFFQFPAWALASEISDADLQNQVNATTEFEESAVSRNLLIKAPYIGSVQEDKYPDLDDFFKRLKKDYPKVLGEPTYVPIAVSGITTVIPVYNQPKLVGDAFVQSRLIDAQIRAMLGKPLIDENQAYYKTQKLQIAKLYDNGYKRAQQSFIIDSLKYGNRLRTAPLFMGSLNHEDLIWPELREINGEMVLVPIVYLTESTIAKHKVTDHQTRFAGEATFADITIDGVKVRLDRNAFLNAVYDLTLVNGGELTGSYDVNVSAGGTLSLLESFITAGDDIKLSAHSVNAQTLVHRYDYGTKQQEYFGTITSVNSQNGNVIVRAYDDINIEGAHIYAGNGITFAADGRVYVGGVLATYTEAGREGKWKYSISNVDYLASKLQAEEAIEIIAGSDIEIDSAEIVSSKGHIELLAGLGITIDNEFTSTNSHRHYKRSKKKRDVKEYETVAIRALLDAGKNIRIHSDEGDITLRATDIKSQDGTTVNASRGGIKLLMAVETDHYRYYGKSKRTFSTRTIDRGHNIETPVYPTIIGGLEANALYGLTVDFELDKSLSRSEQLNKISELAGMEWIKDIRDNDDVTWREIQLAYETWNHDDTNLNAAAIAVISIAVVIASGPAAAAISSSVSTATGAAVASAVGSATSTVSVAATATSAATTVTVASAGTTAAALGAAAGAAASAGFTALVTQASISLADGNSVGDTIEELASNESLESFAVSMVTAAAIAGLDAAFFGPEPEAITTALENAENAALANGWSASEAYQIGLSNAQKANELSLLLQAQQALSNSAVNAVITSVVNGGGIEQFGDAFVQSLTSKAINRLGAELATQIGIASKPDPETGADPQIDQITRYLAHAGTACLTASLNASVNDQDIESSCGAAAGGAVVGEAIGDLYVYFNKDKADAARSVLIDEINHIADLEAEGQIPTPELLAELKADSLYYQYRMDELKAAGVDLARFGAGLSAFIAGADAQNIYVAADAGENAAKHNALPALVWGAMILLTAVDIAITAHEIHEALNVLSDESSTSEEKDQAKITLIELGAETAAGRIVPGAKVGKKILDEVFEEIGQNGKLKNTLESIYDSVASKIGPDAHKLEPSDLDEFTDNQRYTKSGIDLATVDVFSIKEAKRLEGENKGIIFVQENRGSPKNKNQEDAANFEDSTTGAFSEVLSKRRAVPALRYDHPYPNGNRTNNFVKFDGVESDGKTLIDRKMSLPPTPSSAYALERVSKAITDNPGYSVVYEFPTHEAANAAKIFMSNNNIKNITVRVANDV